MKHTVIGGAWRKRLGVYILGTVMMEFGISIAIRAGLGVAPGGVIPYAVSRFTVLSAGWCTTLFQIICILLQLAISKRFTAGLVLQLPLAFVCGRMLDFFLWLLPVFSAGLILSIAILCAGILVFSFGIRAMTGADVLLMPPDGLTKIAGARLGWGFPKAKLVADIIFTAIAAGLMLIFSDELFSVVGIGTVLSAAATGPVVGLFTRLLPFLDIPRPEKAEIK